MKKGLQRVLDVRRLLENLANLDLQAKAAELRQLEGLVEEHRRLAAETRNETLQRLLREPADDSWLAMADADILSWKKERLKDAVRTTGEELAVLGEQRMSRRIERKQTEALVTDAAQAEEQERIRRDQQKTDDWFQNLRSPGSRRSE